MDFIEFRFVSYDDATGEDNRLEYRCRVAELGVDGGGLQFGEWGPWKAVSVIRYPYWDDYCRHCEEVDGTASPTGYG